MSSCRRAGMISLLLHAAVLAGILGAAGLGPHGTVGIAVRGSGPSCEIASVEVDWSPPVPPAPTLLPAVPSVPIPQVITIDAPSQTAPISPVAEIVQPVVFHPPASVPHPVPQEKPPVMPPPGPALNPSLNPAPASGGSNGGASGIRFGGVASEGRSVVFVIDRSASMGLEGRFDRARAAIAESLHTLPPGTKFQVIAYHRAVSLLPRTSSLIAADDSSIAATMAYLDTLVAEGGNGHRNALTLALSLRPDAIYFLTDDDDLTAEDVRVVTQINKGRASIHALCMIPAPASSPMRQLASLNRGRYQTMAR